MPQGIDVQVPSLTSPGTEQLEADDVMALARESNDLLSRNGSLDWVESPLPEQEARGTQSRRYLANSSVQSDRSVHSLRTRR